MRVGIAEERWEGVSVRKGKGERKVGMEGIGVCLCQIKFPGTCHQTVDQALGAS